MERVFTEEVIRAAGEGRTVLLSSHILAEVQRLCSAVTIIKDGRVVEQATWGLCGGCRAPASSWALRATKLGTVSRALEALGSTAPRTVAA